jgi:hypothetical protein
MKVLPHELVDAKDVFDDNNNGYIFGINWLYWENGEIADCQWFKTEEERQQCIDKSV